MSGTNLRRIVDLRWAPVENWFPFVIVISCFRRAQHTDATKRHCHCRSSAQAQFHFIWTIYSFNLFLFLQPSMKLPINWVTTRNRLHSINSTITLNRRWHKSIRKIWRLCCRAHRKWMLYRVRQLEVRPHIMTNCYTFTHRARRDCRRQPLSRIRDTFS